VSKVTREDHGQVAVIRFGEVPVNSFGTSTRRDFVAALEQATADAGIKAIVIAGNGGLFSAGADIKEFGTPAMLAAPNLHNLISAV